jgi:hypothetical protein
MMNPFVMLLPAQGYGWNSTQLQHKKRQIVAYWLSSSNERMLETHCKIHIRKYSDMFFSSQCHSNSRAQTAETKPASVDGVAEVAASIAAGV